MLLPMKNQSKKTDKRVQKGLATKRKIIISTLIIVGTDGVKGLSTRKICEKAGIGKGSLYHHFNNIDEIASEAIIAYLDILRPPAIDRDYNEIKEFFIDLEKEVVKFIDKNRIMGRGFALLLAEHLNNDTLRKRMNQQHIKNVVTTDQKAKAILGTIHDEEELDDILLMLSLLRQGIHHNIAYYGNDEKYDRIWEKILNYFFKDQ